MQNFRIPLRTVRTTIAIARWSRTTYLVHDILKRVGAVNGETDEEKIGLGVGEWSKSVVLFLTGGVPQCKLYALARRLMLLDSEVVFKHSRYVFLTVRSVRGVYFHDRS